jgi:hypothetical protein
MSNLINLLKLEETTLDYGVSNELLDLSSGTLVCASINNIRDVAKKQNMMLCPLEYFDMDTAVNDKMFYKRNRFGIKVKFDNRELVVRAIDNFISYFKDKFKIYALTPIPFYSMSRHLNNSNHNLKIYAPSHQMLFDNLPDYFRQIKKITEEANKQFEIDKAKELALDPMLFAIAKNIDIYDNNDAIIGPCWGQDITFDMINDLNLHDNSNMRDNIINIFSNIKVNYLKTIHELKKENKDLRIQLANEISCRNENNHHELISHIQDLLRTNGHYLYQRRQFNIGVGS